MNAIKFKNVYFSYDGDNDVLTDISFEIKKGKITTIIGHNGSGKSTIAKLMIGLLEAKKGKVLVDDVPLNEDTVYQIRDKIGVVFQNPDNQFIGATVEDDIAFGLENHLVPQAQMKAIIDEYASKVGMDKFLDKEPINLSGGQKQRVAIAGVLAMHPSIIILDEATSMLDPLGKSEIKNTITKMKELFPDLTIISITHDIEEALMSDEIIVINQGKIYVQGSPKDVFESDIDFNEISLDLPFSVKLNNKLAELGVTCENSLEVEGLVNELWQLNLKK